MFPHWLTYVVRRGTFQKDPHSFTFFRERNWGVSEDFSEGDSMASVFYEDSGDISILLGHNRSLSFGDGE